MCLCRLQVASETTLEEADGVYVTKTGPRKPLKQSVSMARFVTLRSLWLRQCNSYTLDRVTPGMPAGLRCKTMHLCLAFPSAACMVILAPRGGCCSMR